VQHWLVFAISAVDSEELVSSNVESCSVSFGGRRRLPELSRL